MAYGTELILGYCFTDKKFDSILDAMELDLRELNDTNENNRSKAILRNVSTDLFSVQRECFKEAGFTDVKNALGGNDYFKAKTPVGVREFVKFSLSYFIDSEEMGEEQEQAVLGISITSRYRPCFADYRNEHGALYPIVFDEELKRFMDIARRHITRVVPSFEDATWIVKEFWY